MVHGSIVQLRSDSGVRCSIWRGSGYLLHLDDSVVGYLCTPEAFEDQRAIINAQFKKRAKEATQDSEDSPPPLAQERLSQPLELLAVSVFWFSAQESFSEERDVDAMSDINKIDLVSASRNPVPLCDVLWIGWDNGVASRRALGVIARDIWESWNPRFTKVTLG
jgi:hypothetical protein